ncbi:MAG TPA: formyl transferase [Hyphomicrobiaceae bacterium]|nr:formyl transferase [Hyphomicrobiaceae bacterium]
MAHTPPVAAHATGPSAPLVLLVADGRMGAIVANAFADRFDRLVVIVEEPERKSVVIQRRARLLGWPTALGQVANGLLTRVAGRLNRRRFAELDRTYGFRTDFGKGLRIELVSSVNSEACRDLLRRLRPSVVAVYGTRIISRATLSAIEAPFINYHAGINPKYRGQDPAYWALASGDAEHAGITIHLVDQGVDTGKVIAQAPVRFDPRDTIATYQYAQLGVALPVFMHAIGEARSGRVATTTVDLPSRQWFPPTIWRYLWNGLRRGVW